MPTGSTYELWDSGGTSMGGRTMSAPLGRHVVPCNGHWRGSKGRSPMAGAPERWKYSLYNTS